MILTSDWHLTDDTNDEYRWAVFGELRKAMRAYKDQDIRILGDLTDRKDRHTGALVNRLVKELNALVDVGATIVCLKGNHDAPLNGEPYWSFLSSIPRLRFVVEPGLDLVHKNLLLLPHSEKPAEAWKCLPWGKADWALMHQTVRGVKFADGEISAKGMDFVFPRSVKRIYSGDIHTPQEVGKVVYVGAPHQVRFGDGHECRMLYVEPASFASYEPIVLSPPCKLIIEISSVKELAKYRVREGDQVKVRLKMSAAKTEQWPVDEEAINEWAKDAGVKLVSAEAELEMAEVQAATADYLADPRDAFNDFCAAEGIEGDLEAAGMELLEGLARKRQ